MGVTSPQPWLRTHSPLVVLASTLQFNSPQSKCTFFSSSVDFRSRQKIWIVNHTPVMADRQDAKAVRLDVRTRRQLLSFMLTAAAGLLFFANYPAVLGAEMKENKKMYTNLEEAREAGEKLREERDIAEGPIITLPSGVKFRDLVPGTGRRLSLGDNVSMQYIIYKLNGLYLDSLGYGKEGKDDVGETWTFQLGKSLIPKAVELGMVGMQLGGRRRILVRPQLGWVNAEILPHPTSSAAQRRLFNNFQQPLLFELELVKILPAE